MLEWQRDPKAEFDNVQLFPGRTKVLSAWPKGLRFALARTWTYESVPRRLLPGLYTWFVWPGYGERALNDYGKLIGKNSFVFG